MEKSRRKKGFALIELMVVVAILSMAAAVFVPRFLKHRIQEKRQECRQALDAVQAAEKAYFEKNGRFAADLASLGWAPAPSKIYQYRFLPTPPASVQRPGFLFECSGNIDKDPTLDRAQIDETGRYVQTVDDTRQ